MWRQDSITTAEIGSLFTKEVEQMGGTVRDAYDDGTRLFLRSVLPAMGDVRRDDRMQSGVALRMDKEQICVHPYLYRLVCKNGAIWAHALQTCRIDYRDVLSPEQVERSLSEAIRACGSEEAFSTAMKEIRAVREVRSLGEVRSAQEIQADLLLNMLPRLAILPEHEAHALIGRIMDGYFRAKDRSRFGLMNAITAVARETTNPQVRWNLEEYGGGIPVALLPPPGKDNSGEQVRLDLYETLFEEQCDELLRARRAYARALEMQEQKTLVPR